MRFICQVVLLSGAKRETSVMRRIGSSAPGEILQIFDSRGQGHSCFSLECSKHMSWCLSTEPEVRLVGDHRMQPFACYMRCSNTIGIRYNGNIRSRFGYYGLRLPWHAHRYGKNGQKPELLRQPESWSQLSTKSKLGDSNVGSNYVISSWTLCQVNSPSMNSSSSSSCLRISPVIQVNVKHCCLCSKISTFSAKLSLYSL